MIKTNVILIWGTFAHQAEWVQPESEFRLSLSNELNKIGIEPEFEVLEWSGENSHLARAEASELLRSKLLEMKEREPNTKVYVIGHSHGGSVVNNTLKTLEKNQYPEQVITLGTPYLISRIRGTFLTRIIVTLLGGIACYPIYLFYVAPIMLSYFFGSERGFEIGFYSVAPLLSILSGYIIGRFISKKTKLAKEEARKYLLAPNQEKVPVISISTFPDEASMLLIFWSFITWLMPVIVMVGMFFIGSIIFDPSSTRGEFASNILLMSGSVLLVVMAAVYFVLIFLLGYLRGKWFAFGSESSFLHLGTQLFVSVIPNRLSRHERVWFLKVWLRGKIRHSMFYSDERVIKLIASYFSSGRFKPSRFVWYRIKFLNSPQILFTMGFFLFFTLLLSLLPS